MKLDDIAKMAINEVVAELEGIKELEDRKHLDENYKVAKVEESLNKPQNPFRIRQVSQTEQDAKQNLDFTQNLEGFMQENQLSLNTERGGLQTENLGNKPKNSDEVLFLQSVKERVEVLFEGLNRSDEIDLKLRLDLNIKFLEFLLAAIEHRLQNLQK